MAAANTAHIADLLSWATQNRSVIHQDVEIYFDDVTGLSFRARNGDISAQTCLVECAYETTLSYLNAIEATSLFSRHNSDAFPPEFLETLSEYNLNVIGYFFLIQQYLLGQNSFWWNYIRQLPQPDQIERLSVPVLWPESDQRFLEGTNAEPAIRKRREFWETEWSTGIALLKHRFEGWDDYTFVLYQWAAAIFGSRSFRPSLTLSPAAFNKFRVGNTDLLLNHIAKDSFSVLLPVLDIGNHNGSDDVSWTHGPGSFSFLNTSVISKGSQIYNFYGSKSNSELLVAYGFMLPQTDNDGVNLKLNPPPEIRQLRRSQLWHAPKMKGQPDEEFMFSVKENVGQENPALSYFSEGLFDTVICMVANARELRWLSEHLEYSAENDTSVFQGYLSKSAHQAVSVLSFKIEEELERLLRTRPGIPQNQNQSLALDYRKRQEDVLKFALSTILEHLNSTKFVGLHTAFTWLSLHYPTLSTEIESLISDDQDEPLPLNWDVLAEDWDRTYFIVWIHIVLSLQLSDSSQFEINHAALSQWISNVQGTGEAQDHKLLADKSELETINLMVDFISRKFRHSNSQKERMRNLASFIFKEEVVRGLSLCTGMTNKTTTAQNVLFIDLS